MPYTLKPPAPGRSSYWRVRGTEHGIRIDRSTKETSRSEALKWLAKWKADAKRDALSDQSEKPLTFVRAATAYVNAGGEEQFLKPLVLHFGERAIADISQGDIDTAAVMLYPNGGAPTRNRAVYTPMSAILRHNGVTLNLRRPKGALSPPRAHWLRPEQAFALLEAGAAVDDRFGALLTFLLYTGVRLSDGLRLEWKDVDLARASAICRDTKNNTDIVIHLPPKVVAALANLPPAGNRVFGLAKCGRLYSWLAEAEANAGVTLPARSAFHILRHSHATWRRRFTGADTSALVDTGLWKSRNAAAVYEHFDVSEEARKSDMLPTSSAPAILGKTRARKRK